MKVKINRLEFELPQNCNLLQALEIYEVKTKIFAIAVNEKFIPKSHYSQTIINPFDTIDIIVPMQGG